MVRLRPLHLPFRRLLGLNKRPLLLRRLLHQNPSQHKFRLNPLHPILGCNLLTSVVNGFYTCNKTTPYDYSFMGCCRTTLCNEGCLDDMLDAAALPKMSIAWPAYAVATTATAWTNSTTIVSNIIPSSSKSSTSSSRRNVGAIVGGVLGGFAILILPLLLIWCFLYLSRKSRDAQQKGEVENQKHELDASEHSLAMSTIHESETAGK